MLPQPLGSVRSAQNRWSGQSASWVQVAFTHVPINPANVLLHTQIDPRSHSESRTQPYAQAYGPAIPAIVQYPCGRAVQSAAVRHSSEGELTTAGRVAVGSMFDGQSRI